LPDGRRSLHLCDRCKESTQTLPPTVTEAMLIRKEIVEWDEYTGRTEAVESVEIRQRVSGYTDQISSRDGQLVKPGEVLFMMDPHPYQDALDQANAHRIHGRLNISTLGNLPDL
jgi:multidrug efflux pump subunit AcrA (membrane-fusion protein)